MNYEKISFSETVNANPIFFILEIQDIISKNF